MRHSWLRGIKVLIYTQSPSLIDHISQETRLISIFNKYEVLHCLYIADLAQRYICDMHGNILVLCTGNSCRSQMAEAYLKLYFAEASVYSAGVETHGVNALAVQVMAEDKVDISRQTSNHVDEYSDIKFDLILTVCDHARERCPVFPSTAVQIHNNFSDPSKQDGPLHEILPLYRSTREEIKAFILNLDMRELLT